MKRTTARDVAALAGCSVSAVSLVVNGHADGRIKDELRQRIIDAVEQLHYRPNGSARDLARQMPSNVGFLCPDVSNPFFGQVYTGALGGLRGQFGLDLRVQAHGQDYDLETVRSIQAGNLAGLILAGPADTVIDGFQPTCPTVVIDTPASRTALTTVELDLAGASQQIANHLASLSHRHIAYIDLDNAKSTFVIRRRALADALAEHGSKLADVQAAPHMTTDAGRDLVRMNWDRWIKMGISAIVCADDVLAYGVLAATRELGVSVPQDMSLASYNDLAFSQLLDPALTSVDFNAQQLGRTAANMLLNIMSGTEPFSVCMPTQLHARASTAPYTTSGPPP
ncbi:LacI family DNA-binding transcriptional regulator [Streptomyces hokutonensis]|uniref:LacI family DNA-binding transcriptional regulator n=1 Tax=Streptomyces hokutonensis TaxID=1306990 RepID=UPI00382E1824